MASGPNRDARAQDSGIPAVEQQARRHASVRQAHETELIEDYIELIAELVDAQGEARAVDLARRFGVTPPTVARMLRRLRDQDLIVRERYGTIHLTDSGRSLAERSRHRHAVVLSFLKALGVSDEAARRDAGGIEHHVSAETLDTMYRFILRGQ